MPVHHQVVGHIPGHAHLHVALVYVDPCVLDVTAVCIIISVHCVRSSFLCAVIMSLFKRTLGISFIGIQLTCFCAANSAM